MPNTRNQVAQRVATSLRNLEDTIDHACAAAGDHFATLSRARKEARLAAEMGHEALEKMVGAMRDLIAVRRTTLEQHSALEACRVQLRLTVTSDGDKAKLPPPGGLLVADESIKHLRVVA